MKAIDRASEYADKIHLQEGERRDNFIEGFVSGYSQGMADAGEKWSKFVEKLYNRRPSIPDAEIR